MLSFCHSAARRRKARDKQRPASATAAADEAELEESREAAEAAMVEEKGGEEVDAEENARWNAAQWLQSLGLHAVIAGALELPEPGKKQFNFVRKLRRETLESMLNSEERPLVSGLIDVIMEGVESLSGSGGATQDGAVSNDKFQTNAKFQMSYAHALRNLPHACLCATYDLPHACTQVRLALSLLRRA